MLDGKLLGLFTLIMLFFIIPSTTSAQELSLQRLIDDALVGETITIPAGVYDEPIVIHKQVQLVGSADVLFDVTSDEPAITIDAHKVTLEQIAIQYRSDKPEQAAILVQSDDNTLAQIHIDSENRGILLDNAHDNLLTDITVRGNEQVPIPMRQRGIDLWKSNKNTITNTDISFVEDGIYIESSFDNIIHDNRATHSRYGYHLMFTKETELFANESYENISGMMIMGTSGTQVYDNTLQHNQKNVQSLGLLLFDVTDALVENNDIGHNRLGIFVEDASENEITSNHVHNNFIGLQFKRAEMNTIHHNAFSANVVQGLAEESMDNNTNNNYWSDHSGLDLTGNNTSDLVYKVDPFYLHLTNKYPPYRLLFQAPGFLFLEKMMHTPVEQQLIDEAPLLVSPFKTDDTSINQHYTLLIISTILLMMSLFIIHLGVKQG